MRCHTHVFNLIVNLGLKKDKDSIFKYKVLKSDFNIEGNNK